MVKKFAVQLGCMTLAVCGAVLTQDTPQPLSGYTIPDSSPSPEASQSDPPSYLKGAPYGGKGGAPKFDHLPE